MLWDWIAREGWMLPVWWLLVTLAGAAVFPLLTRLLRGLPDRGYTLARAAGMLLVGFVYWLMASYGFTANTTGGMVLAWGIVFTISLLAYATGQRLNWREYWRENRTLIIAAELLFIVLFFSWTVYRAYQHDTFTTEKPMEIAFISAIMRSETFPPNDMWMAGYSISYYHFGYLMTAMLSMLSGVHSGYGFSLMIALLFALTGLTAFGVAYNLVRARANRPDDTTRRPSKTPALISGLLAVIFVVLSGNFQLPLIEMPYKAQSMPVGWFDFWSVQGYTDVETMGYTQQNSPLTITTPFDHPDDWVRGGWWWWHTSRILVDYNLDGTMPGAQPIDEVPAFSFLLMDVHPHVLSLPFVVLAIGLALNLVLLGRAPTLLELTLYGVTVGGLLFLNTWDGPIYLVVLAGAEALRRTIRNAGRLYSDDWLGIFGFGLILIVIAVVAYLPFLIGFRSQAGGPLPNLITPTLFRHYFVMFGPLLLVSGAFLLTEAWRFRDRLNLKLGALVAGGIFFALLLIHVLLVIVGALLPETRSLVANLLAANGGWEAVLPVVIERRIAAMVLPLVLLIALALIVARLFPSSHATDDQPSRLSYAPSTGLALLLMAAALGVTLVPEFFFLRDNFGLRINTIFKFYYQAWVMLGIVSAYAAYALLWDNTAPRRNPVLRPVFGIMLSLVLIAGLAFPVFGVYTRAILEEGRLTLPVEQQRPLTLDGRFDSLPADYVNAVLCLGDLVQGDDVVVAEASRDTYNSSYGRVGAFTGLPTVINWENHQRQWRGATYNAVAGTRRADMDRLYTDLRWDIVQPIIDQYGIDYIVFGPNERRQYGPVGEEKFIENLTPVCQVETTTIYRVPDTAIVRQN